MLLGKPHGFPLGEGLAPMAMLDAQERKLRDGVVAAIVHFQRREAGHQLTMAVHILLQTVHICFIYG